MRHTYSFILPDGGKWLVRAYLFPDAESARVVWEEIETESLGKGNFSIWRTANPEMTKWFIVICGRSEYLPEIEGGEPYDLGLENARAFAARRAKAGVDAIAEHPDAERFDQQMRYGIDNPQVIDAETGEVKPYLGT